MAIRGWVVGNRAMPQRQVAKGQQMAGSKQKAIAVGRSDQPQAMGRGATGNDRRASITGAKYTLKANPYLLAVPPMAEG